MWSICDICGAVIADETLHYAWHYPTGTDLIPYPNPELEPSDG